MEIESKYTSPLPRRTSRTLAAYTAAMANATGTSMPTRRALQRAQRAREERPRRIEHHRGRHQQAQPAQQLARGCIERLGGAEVDRGGVHHGLHRAEAGDQQPLERVARLAATQIVEAARVQRQRAIAGARERLQQLRQRHFRVAPDHARAPRHRIDLHADDSRHGAERALDQPDAGGATHAFDQQQGFAQARAQVADHMARIVGALPGIVRRVWPLRPASVPAPCAAGSSRPGRVARSIRPRRGNPGSTSGAASPATRAWMTTPAGSASPQCQQSGTAAAHPDDATTISAMQPASEAEQDGGTEPDRRAAGTRVRRRHSLRATLREAPCATTQAVISRASSVASR